MKPTDERFLRNYDLHLLKSCTFAGAFQMPEAERYHGELPAGLEPFHKAVSRKNAPVRTGRHLKTPGRRFVHFFLDDCLFERLWNAPERYLTTLSAYAGVLSPDFSLYRDMPTAMQLWNTYRNRVLTCWMQQQGLPVIPTVSWSDSSSYAFCFDGLPRHGTFALSTVGTQQKRDARRLFRDGFCQFIERCQPDTLVVYGEPLRLISEMQPPLQVFYYPNDNLQRLRQYGR